MAAGADWSSNANEVLQIRLPNSPPFQPTFSYAIFGEEESIFGYKGLKVELGFTGNHLKPRLSITWQEKYEQVGGTQATDVEGILNEFLPSHEDSEDTSIPVVDETTTWEPPGELLHQYEVNGQAFGIWSTTLIDPIARALLRNVEILVLFFIEGASLLDLDDTDSVLERWRLFLIYEIKTPQSTPNASAYSLVGYSTSFRLYFVDPSSPHFTFPSAHSDESYSQYALEPVSDLTSYLPCRQRISQFLILPHHQQSGHGSHLYTTMIRFFLNTPSIKEITVEDPNESFDDLRDVNDLLRLRATDTHFATLGLNTDVRLSSDRSKPIPSSDLVSSTLLDSIRTATKIAPRQFSRLVEMQLLNSIPHRHRYTARITRKDRASDKNDRAYYFWRLLTKQRLYKFNLDQLAQLDLEERIDKLEETLGGVERDYVRILEATEKRWAKSRQETPKVARADTTSATLIDKVKKRKIVVDDDEEDENRVVKDAASTNGNGKKRARTQVNDLASSEL